LSAAGRQLYRIHGLLVESEVPLQAVPGDANGAAAAAPDYHLRVGDPVECPPSPPPGRLLGGFGDETFAYWVTQDEDDAGRWTIRYAGICQAVIDRGERSMTVHGAVGGDPDMIPVFVEGSLLAHVLAAEGLLAIHASAVEWGGAALALVGPSGMGKSTLAALLCSAGARLVADDALRVDVAGGIATCFPGSRRLRLRTAAAPLGRAMEGAALTETADGRTAVRPARLVDAPLPLRAALLPEPSREVTRLEVQRLGAVEAVQELLSYPRLTRWESAEQIGTLFRLTADVAAAVPVYRATVPWGPPFPHGLAEELLAGVGLDAAGAAGRRESA
jgi:hypothetical protein